MDENKLDLVTILSPIQAGLILNAFYTALLLKKFFGVDITEKIREETLQEVLEEWAEISVELDKTLPRKKIFSGVL